MRNSEEDEGEIERWGDGAIAIKIPSRDGLGWVYQIRKLKS